MNKKLVNTWGRGVSHFPSIQQKFDENITLLLDTYFTNANEYQKEKFIKSCFDQVRHLESLLLQQQGVDFDQLKNIKSQDEVKNFAEEMNNIEQSMLIIVKRMFRHATIYLPAVNLTGKPKDEEV